MTTPHRFQMTFDGRAYAVAVNGRDVSDQVAAVDVHANPHDLPRVVLHLRPTGTWPDELDVLARVEVGVPAEPGAAAAAFLARWIRLRWNVPRSRGRTWRTYRAAGQPPCCGS
ncbi:hypothetical protein [Streptomyces mirabilis]